MWRVCGEFAVVCGKGVEPSLDCPPGGSEGAECSRLRAFGATRRNRPPWPVASDEVDWLAFSTDVASNVVAGDRARAGGGRAELSPRETQPPLRASSVFTIQLTSVFGASGAVGTVSTKPWSALGKTMMVKSLP